MKKPLYIIILLSIVVESCHKTSSTTTQKTNSTNTTNSSTITSSDLVGYWVYDSVVSYQAGVRQGLYPASNQSGIGAPANGSYMNLLPSLVVGSSTYYQGTAKPYDGIQSTPASSIQWSITPVINSNRMEFTTGSGDVATGLVRTVNAHSLIIEPKQSPLEGFVYYLHK